MAEPRELTVQSIGRVVSGRREADPDDLWETVVAEIEVDPAWAGALDGLEGFSHVWLLWWLDRFDDPPETVRVRPEGRPEMPLTGIFATRSPRRPNPLALTAVRLVERQGTCLRVQGLDAYEGTLFNAALRITGSRDDAMDVTQNAFVKAYEKLHTFNPSYRFFSWIYRITVNEAINLSRRRPRETAIGGNQPAEAPNPEQASQQAQTSRAVHRALRRLSPEHRTLVVLKHLEGLSYQEMATILTISEKKVKSRLFTARRELRKILSEKGMAR